MRYVAFLRGVNVGGNRVVRMRDVCVSMEQAGFAVVTSVGASGNILYSAEDADTAAMAARIAEALSALACGQVEVMVRSLAELRDMVADSPFGDETADRVAQVTFLPSVPTTTTRELRETAPAHIDVVLLRERELFLLRRRGEARNPAGALGKLLRIGTTRNWSVVCGLVERGEG